MKRGAVKIGRKLLLVSLGGVFTIAGISKASDPETFALAIAHYRLVPWWCAVALALYLPFLEIFAASALLFIQTRRAALFILLLLSLTFTGALLFAEYRHLNIECGCFEIGQNHTSTKAAIARNCLILTGITFLLRSKKVIPSVVPSQNSPPSRMT